MVGSSNCARAVATVAVVVAAEDIRSKGVVDDTLPTVVDTADGRDRMDGTSAEVHFPEHRHEVRLEEEVRVTVVCVGTEEGSCLRAVDTGVVVVDTAGNEAAAWHDCPWATLVAWILVLD
jgi:hypothetical protein